MHCPTLDELEDFLAGLRPADARGPLCAHLERCARCRQALDLISDEPDLREWARGASSTQEGEDDGPGLARLLETGSRMRVERIVASGRPDEPPSLEFLGPPRHEGDIGTLGPYRVLELLGHGGMGIVLRGRDDVLDRAVALKVLRPALADGRDRTRFVREARAAARVRHDHVVEVHSVANPTDGLPYIVMECLDGPALSEAIQRAGRLGPREAASVALQVAEGLAAAHAAGLVHRDIKPSNVMLDPASGRTKITDFGLARPAGGPSDVTQDSSTVGTPAYMSPEQARGDAVDARTDVYSVGATLYQALTGEPPFRGTASAVLRQVIESDPPPPRRINSALPRDLETICMKAMARDAAGRYPTARDLADDLGRFLRGETILARPAGVLERTWSFSRRRPLIVCLAAALAVVSVGGITGVVWQWRRAEAQRAQAEHNFRQARRLVDAFYTRAFVERVFARPGLETVHREMFRDLLGYYRDFLRQRGDDPSLRADLAEACYRVACLSTEQGDRADAIEAFRQAESLFQTALDRNPADRDARLKRAACVDHIGRMEAELGHLETAARRHENSSMLLRRLVADHPQDREARRKLAGSLGNLANVRTLLHDFARARLGYTEVLQILEQLVAEEPSVAGHRDDLALTFNNLAMRAEDPHECARLFRKALELREELVALDPTNPVRRRNVARSCQNLGLVEYDLGHPSEGMELLERCCNLLEEVVKSDPTSTMFQCDLAQGYSNQSHVLGRAGRLDESVKSGRRAREIYEALLAIHPRLDGARTGLAMALANIAESLSRQGEFSAAAESIDRSVAIARERVRELPDDTARRTALAEKLCALAGVYRKLGRSPAALGFEREAADLRQSTNPH
jgi:tetratricopeptide (TPR) repeat protein/tRNA A-37 threonylcarbamoyl transferase component Bud32